MLDRTAQKRLDELFDKLKKTGSPMAGQQLAGRIADRWNESGSATIDLMMGWARDAIEAKKYDIALDFLDQATVMKPDYAEAYNRRATVHYLMGSYNKAMADIEKTLQLEPRHYGALAAMASMMQARGLKQSAVAIYARILDIYPSMREAQSKLGELSEELEPRAI